MLLKCDKGSQLCLDFAKKVWESYSIELCYFLLIIRWSKTLLDEAEKITEEIYEFKEEAVEIMGLS